VSRPLEIRAAMGVYLVGAALFLGAGALRDASSLVFPIVVAVLAVLAFAGLLVRWQWAGPAAFIVGMVVALAHMLIVLGSVHWAFRVLSGVLAAAHVYACVLVMTKPAREYLGTAA
jgi:hypothetical protein